MINLEMSLVDKLEKGIDILKKRKNMFESKGFFFQPIESFSDEQSRFLIELNWHNFKERPHFDKYKGIFHKGKIDYYNPLIPRPRELDYESVFSRFDPKEPEVLAELNKLNNLNANLFGWQNREFEKKYRQFLRLKYELLEGCINDITKNNQFITRPSLLLESNHRELLDIIRFLYKDEFLQEEILNLDSRVTFSLFRTEFMDSYSKLTVNPAKRLFSKYVLGNKSPTGKDFENFHRNELESIYSRANDIFGTN